MIPISRPSIGEEEKQAVLRVLESGRLTQGNTVQAFEKAFAEYCGVRYALAVSSGTAALHTALLAHGIGPGDLVITTPFSFVSSTSSIILTGARPIFVDIDPATFNIDPVEVRDKAKALYRVGLAAKAILPVHLFGCPCDMRDLGSIAQEYGLIVIEDACQAHGASVDGKKVGTCQTGCFSFFPSKNITSGEGGMVTTNDWQIAERVAMLRSHGMRERYHYKVLGFNYRMSDIHAAIGLTQLRKLDRLNEERIRNAAYLTERLKGVVTPLVPEGYRHVFHQYTIRIGQGARNAVVRRLSRRGVGARVYYPNTLSTLPYLDNPQHFPNAEAAAREVVSLPVHPGLSRDDLNWIVEAVNEFTVL